MVTRFNCGHIGRENIDSKRAKAKEFIGVAEIRREVVEEADKPCPNCKGK